MWQTDAEFWEIDFFPVYFCVCVHTHTHTNIEKCSEYVQSTYLTFKGEKNDN